MVRDDQDAADSICRYVNIYIYYTIYIWYERTNMPRTLYA